MKTFHFPVALRMEGRCRGLPEFKFRNQIEEILRGELLPVIVDYAGMRIGMEFLRPGHENFNVQAFHRGEKVPDENLAAEPVQDAGEVEEHSANSDVGIIRMPLFIRTCRLVEPLFPRFRRKSPFAEKVVPLQYVVNRRWTGVCDIPVYHKPGQVAVSMQMVLVLFAEVDDGASLFRGHPVGLRRIVVMPRFRLPPRNPVVPCTLRDSQKGYQPGRGDSRPCVNGVDFRNDGGPFGEAHFLLS